MSSANDYAMVQVDHVTKHFGVRHGAFTAVDDVSLDFESGATIGIVGESGSGKSTLARMMAGLVEPTFGTVTLNGRDLADMKTFRNERRLLRQTLQLVGQDSTSSFDPRLTVRQSLRVPLTRLRDMDRDQADAVIDDTLEMLDLRAEHADRAPSELSGGQRQRASLARALVVRPRLLICDEVVSALDVSVQGEVLNFLKQYCTHARAGLLFVSHGLPATAFVCREMVVMHRGRIVERGSTDRVIEDPEHSYTKRLLAAHGRD